ncbi:hypothetical protein BS47DRAFT_1349878 [Hydnum rufescens UP504]|uniref:LYR motif-containing protein Cup1-like N-terminal domain-containing protein n=1 Tax=Hydnum rufescens UP504 TaxID=1448309 RepID=A0A9P6DSS5_9AGAM|nr:hypothetical protein BS47DRAFT_1349878 [Hydnum rufescens UP504]
MPTLGVSYAHRKKVIGLFRSLLRESYRLPHLYLRAFWRARISDAFKRNQKLESIELAERKLTSWGQELRRLRAANRGEHLAVKRVLDFAYGRRGKLRQELMARIQSDPSTPEREPLIPANPSRSRPPKLPQSLTALFNFPPARTTGKSISPAQLHNPPTLPLRADPHSEEARLLGPLSLRREVNIHWKYFTEEKSRILPPLEMRMTEAIPDGKIGTKDPDSRVSLIKRGVNPDGTPLFEMLERLATPPPPKLPRRAHRRGPEVLPENPHHSQEINAVPKEVPVLPATSVTRTSHASKPPTRSLRFFRRRYQEILASTPILHYVTTHPADNVSQVGNVLEGKYSVSLSPHALRKSATLGHPFSPPITDEDRIWLEKSGALARPIQEGGKRRS